MVPMVDQSLAQTYFYKKDTIALPDGYINNHGSNRGMILHSYRGAFLPGFPRSARVWTSSVHEPRWCSALNVNVYRVLWEITILMGKPTPIHFPLNPIKSH